MGKINVLPFAVANLIAAGEVVDRPASVIKELMENAIDAHARHVTVEIQNGGVTFMRVSDDGCGMEADDLPVAIRRHATSKIHDASDLDGIATLGFRGEALAAIASVSDLRILSKRREDAMGTILTSSGGEILSLGEAGCTDGTTVIVEALFANVPARRKFLKKDMTEAQAVTVTVERVALSHPEIAFKLILDGEIRLQTAGDSNLTSTVFAVFGRDFTHRLLPLSGEYEGIGVSGFVGRSDNVKGNRNYQNFFINGRWIKSKTAMAALEQAFCSYLPQERYPVCVMNITLDPARVDVNVHPAKLEVKFSNEKLIFEAVYYTVRHALEQNETRPDLILPETGVGKKGASESRRRVSDAFAPVNDRALGKKQEQLTLDTMEKPSTLSAVRATPASGEHPVAPGGVNGRITAEQYVKEYLQAKKDTPAKRSATAPGGGFPNMPDEAEKGPSPVAQGFQTPKAARTQPSTLPKPSESTPERILDNPDCETAKMTGEASCPAPSAPASTVVLADRGPQPEGDTESTVPGTESAKRQADAPETPWRIVGEVFHSYILVETGSRMLIIDQHAAHERVLFEQLKARLHSTTPAAQMLMIPLEVMLMSDEVAALSEFHEELTAIGFEMETARNTVTLHALPVGIDTDVAGDMLAAIADRIKNNTGSARLTRDILFEKALYQGSCKAAIKAGRVYAEGHLEWLVGQLMALPDITFCPHGRPVAMEVTKQNLDHQFERT